MKSTQVRIRGRREKIYHGWRRALYSWVSLAVLFGLVILLARATWRVYVKWERNREEALTVKARFEAEERRLGELREEVTRLRTPAGLEEELRKNFPVARPGEEVVVIVDKSTSTNR